MPRGRRREGERSLELIIANYGGELRFRERDTLIGTDDSNFRGDCCRARARADTSRSEVIILPNGAAAAAAAAAFSPKLHFGPFRLRDLASPLIRRPTSAGEFFAIFGENARGKESKKFLLTP